MLTASTPSPLRGTPPFQEESFRFRKYMMELRTKIAMFATVCLLLSQAIAANRLLPQGSPPAKTLDVADIAGQSADLRLAAITLQGLVNRGDESSIYYIAEKNCNDMVWLEQMVEEKAVGSYQNIGIDELFKKYGDVYSTVVIYDDKLPSTINVAMMIGSIDDGIAISALDVERFGKGKKVVDLRGKWHSNVQAYQWAVVNLLPKMNKDVLACFHPNYIPHNIRDYLVAHKIFTFWITSEEKQDGITSSFEDEKTFAVKLFRKYKPNTPVLGFWYSGEDCGINEYPGVGLAGEYGLLSLPCDWSTNLSVHSGITVDWEPVVKKYRQTRLADKPVLDKSKIYICFSIIESGDAPVYWQNGQYMVWSDKKAGQIPINWSVGPATMELMPLIMKWYYDRMAPKDHFFIGLSGAGYVHPYRNLFGKAHDPEKAWKDYLALTDDYMKTYGIDHISLYTDAWMEFDRSKKDSITSLFADNLSTVQMIMMGMGRDEGMTAVKANYTVGKKNVLVSHVMTRWNAAGRMQPCEENIQWLVDEIKKQSPESKPGFMMVHPLSWAYYASDLIEVANRLGTDYEVIGLTAYQQLVNEAGYVNQK